MAGMGPAVMGTATAKGENRATLAAQAAIASPLLEAGAIDGARGILINITGSSSLKLSEVHEASTIIQSAAHEDANIIFGAVLDEKMKDEVKITVIATGFKTEHMQQRGQRVTSAAAAIAQQRTASAYTPNPRIEPRADRAPEVRTEPVPEPVPTAPEPAFRATTPTPVTPQRDTTTLDSVKNNVKAAFEEDDLDVPAFIRKQREHK